MSGQKAKIDTKRKHLQIDRTMYSSTKEFHHTITSELAHFDKMKKKLNIFRNKIHPLRQNKSPNCDGIHWINLLGRRFEDSLVTTRNVYW